MQDPADGVARLREEVRALRADLTAEVRTRRVVVVDESGVERVRVTAGDGVGSVMVRLDRARGRTTGIELVAAEDPEGGDEPVVRAVRLVDGDVTSIPDLDGGGC